MLQNQIKVYLSNLKRDGLYRKRASIDRVEQPLNFSSNDYLSLTNDSRVKQAYQKGFELYPTGSGGSMVVCGYHPVHQTLEQTFCQALRVDDCVLFSSGYAANLSVVNLLAHIKAHVLIDKAAHASIYDGLKLAGLPFTRYLHNNLDDLNHKMHGLPITTALITESINSMSGEIAPLDHIASLVQTYQHALIVDEAHAFGVLGREGLGVIEKQGLAQQEIPLRILPFGKAMGGFGAVVAGHGEWIDALLQAGRSYTYSTGLSPAFTYGLLKAFDIVRAAEERRAKLQELIVYFQHAIQSSPLKWRYSNSPIQQLQLGCPYLALQYSSRLREKGIFCLPMRQPTVPKTETGLRIILNYHHQPEDIDYLLSCLHEN